MAQERKAAFEIVALKNEMHTRPKGGTEEGKKEKRKEEVTVTRGEEG